LHEQPITLFLWTREHGKLQFTNVQDTRRLITFSAVQHRCELAEHQLSCLILRFIMVLCLTGGTRVAFLCFFASHIPITLFIDGQAALPHYIYPRIVQDLLDWYTGTFKDHLMSRPHDLWFTSIVTCELIFQVPFFFYAVYALSNPARVSLALMSVCLMARQLCRFISFLIFCIGVRKG